MLFKMYNKHISVPYKNYIEPIRTTSGGERLNLVSPPILKTPITVPILGQSVELAFSRMKMIPCGLRHQRDKDILWI